MKVGVFRLSLVGRFNGRTLDGGVFRLIYMALKIKRSLLAGRSPRSGGANMKYIAVVVCLACLTACSTVQTKGAFKSGWTSRKNEAAFKMCALYRPKKGGPSPQDMDGLIAFGMLTEEQANRASKALVLPGDPECLAYAAYGHRRKDVGEIFDAKGVLLERYATYDCDDNDVACPGIRVDFADGKVVNVSVLP